MILAEVIKVIEDFAPLSLQESYDNAGLYCGDTAIEIHKILLCLDVTEAVVDEAVLSGCQLVIAHHPVIFKPMKKLIGANYTERVLLKAIKNNIALYAAHTNLDNIAGGVNYKLAQKIGLSNIQILQPSNDTLSKLTFFVPKEDSEKVLKAVCEAGAGQIGNYKDCSFQVEGLGAFTPNENATPYIGVKNKKELVAENRLEVIVPKYLQHKVLKALFASHPYEEVAYYISAVSNLNQEVGAGAIGVLEKPVSQNEFLGLVKNNLGLELVRYTSVDKEIKKVAVCGGVGSFLLKKAIAEGADAFVTADFKYHEFFDAENKIMIADVGHYESENYTKEVFFELLTKKIPNIAVLFSTVNTNPVKYYY